MTTQERLLSSKKIKGRKTMYCHKCGNKLPEDSGFCHKCGAKIVHTDAVQQTPNAVMPTEEPRVASVVDPPPIASAAPAQTVVYENIPPAGVNELRAFVYNHVRTTTKYQSATDLLQNGKPSKLVLLVALPGLLITLRALFLIPSMVDTSASMAGSLLLGLVVFVFFFYILVTLPLRAAAFVRKLRYSSKFDIACDRHINKKDFASFLNSNMKYLLPDMGEWDSSHEIYVNCTVDKSTMSIIMPSGTGAKKFEFSISTAARGNPLSFWSFILLPVYVYNLILDMSDVRTGEYNIFYKTVPILSSAVDYYMKKIAR
jgi:hypothetical protein